MKSRGGERGAEGGKKLLMVQFFVTESLESMCMFT